MTSTIKSFVAATVFAVTAIASVASAHAGEFDYLNHINPAYTNCINNVKSQIAPGQMTTKVNDAILNSCHARYPAFAQRQPLTSQQLGTIGKNEQEKARTVGSRVVSIFGHRG